MITLFSYITVKIEIAEILGRQYVKKKKVHFWRLQNFIMMNFDFLARGKSKVLDGILT